MKTDVNRGDCLKVLTVIAIILCSQTWRGKKVPFLVYWDTQCACLRASVCVWKGLEM